MKFGLSIALMALGLFVANPTWAQDSFENLSEPELSQRISAAEGKKKRLEAEIDALSQIKDSIASSIARTDQLAYPSGLEKTFSALKKRVGRSIDNQSIGTIFQIMGEFNMKLGSVAPELMPRGFYGAPGPQPTTLRQDISSELYMDFDGTDILVKNYLPMAPDADLNEETRQELRTLLDTLSPTSFNTKRTQLKNYLKSKLEVVSGRLNAKRQELVEVENNLRLLYPALEKKKKAQTQIDEALVTYGIPAIALTMISLIIVPMFYRRGNAQEYILNSGLLVQIFTIFLLTSTILVLGFAGKIESNSLGTLLGGISGYVLGRTAQGGRSRRDDDHDDLPTGGKA